MTIVVKKKMLTPEEQQKKLEQEIAKRKAKFKKASPAQKRVLIAKDVIAQVKAKRFIATAGRWAILRDKRGKNIALSFTETPVANDAQVQSLFLSGAVATCECCALGGIMLSCTLYNSNQTVKDFSAVAGIGARVARGDKFSNGLHRFFSQKQLALIECAFEGGKGEFGIAIRFDYLNFSDPIVIVADLLKTVPRDTLKRAVGYMTQYPAADKRILAIMQNIIKNKGTFKP